jgi:hypothetical protein
MSEKTKQEKISLRVRMVPFVEQDEQVLRRASRRLSFFAELFESDDALEEARFLSKLCERLLYESQVVSVQVSRSELFPGAKE